MEETIDQLNSFRETLRKRTWGMTLRGEYIGDICEDMNAIDKAIIVLQNHQEEGD